MKRIYEAGKGRSFTAGELVEILHGYAHTADVRVACRMNGKPFRVTVDDGDEPDNTRPETVPAHKGREEPLFDAADSRKPGLEGWLRLADEQLADEAARRIAQDRPNWRDVHPYDVEREDGFRGETDGRTR